MTHPAPIAHSAQTAAALRRIRALWGELLIAIETPPADVWPPRQLAHTLNPTPDEPVVERLPLTLREFPAPVNLAALDTGVFIEEALFDLADLLASTYQRTEPGDLRRWRIRTETTPGSRAHGLHWAATWIEGRVLDEDTEPGPRPDGTCAPAPFLPLRESHRTEARRTAQACEQLLVTTLGLDHRHTPIPDRPCPWCTGQLTLHTGPDTSPTVTCDTGPSCTAPVLIDDRGRRIWRWRDLPALGRALDAAQYRVR